VKKNDQREIEWTSERVAAFDECKRSVAEAVQLAHPCPNAKLALICDASDVAIGAALEQLVEDSWQPLGFFSKKMTNTEKNYSTYDRELLAVYESIKYFKHWLEGRIFFIKTDHKPLLYAFKQRPEKASPRQLRHLSFISQFSTEIVHVKGADNVVADAFSRLCTIDMPVAINLSLIEQAQAVDSELSELLKGSTSLKLQKVRYDEDVSLYCDISTGSEHIHTTAYHPQSNGLVERWHRSFKVALICHSDTPWVQHLPAVLLGLRTCYKEDLKISVSELIYGTPIRVPNEFF
ncbi:hypothetical protein KR222_003403, partial [Zaprionus bogoriensis]